MPGLWVCAMVDGCAGSCSDCVLFARTGGTSDWRKLPDEVGSCLENQQPVGARSVEESLESPPSETGAFGLANQPAYFFSMKALFKLRKEQANAYLTLLSAVETDWKLGYSALVDGNTVDACFGASLEARPRSKVRVRPCWRLCVVFTPLVAVCRR